MNGRDTRKTVIYVIVPDIPKDEENNAITHIKFVEMYARSIILVIVTEIMRELMF